IKAVGPGLLQPGEGIGLHGLMETGGEAGMIPIEGKIPLGRGQGVGADVEIENRNCSPPSRVEGKAPRKAKGVQHLLAPGMVLHEAPIFALIEKETRLLPLQDVGLEAQAVFEKNDRS